MPLEILLILVVVGIAAIAALLHLTGRSKQRNMNSDDARAQWQRHFPDDRILDITLGHDGHAAIVETDRGPGLLWAMGTDTVGRRLQEFDLAEEASGLRIVFHDFSAPKVTLKLNKDETRLWQDLISSK